MHVLGLDGEREAQGLGQTWPGLAWFSLGTQCALTSFCRAKQDSCCFLGLGFNIGFNKRGKKKGTSKQAIQKAVICLQHFRTLRKGVSCHLEELWG